MPPPSEAVLRYAIIDRCLTNVYQKFPSMEMLQKACEYELKSGVSSFTIQKDINLMKKDEKLGYFAPIKFSKARNGYYYDKEEYTIQSFGINEKEIEAIELATSVLQQFKGMKVNDSFNHAIDKIFAALNIKKSATEKLLVNAIQPEEMPYLKGMENFETLVNAIRKKIPVSFIHYSYDKKLFKSIIIHPYLLKESNKRWYLLGYSEEHKAIRHFGIDRIYDPILINTKFTENTNSNLLEIYNNKIGLNTLRKNHKETPEEIVIWVSKIMANYIKSMPVHPTQSLIEFRGKGELLLTLNLTPTQELIALILSYGHHMIVRQPLWLKNHIAGELENAAAMYKK